MRHLYAAMVFGGTVAGVGVAMIAKSAHIVFDVIDSAIADLGDAPCASEADLEEPFA